MTAKALSLCSGRSFAFAQDDSKSAVTLQEILAVTPHLLRDQDGDPKSFYGSSKQALRSSQ
jgi:hypothetical protein